jgi:hypothetical protein
MNHQYITPNFHAYNGIDLSRGNEKETPPAYNYLSIFSIENKTTIYLRV